MLIIAAKPKRFGAGSDMARRFVICAPGVLARLWYKSREQKDTFVIVIDELRFDGQLKYRRVVIQARPTIDSTP